jgi:adenine deaminase
LGDDKVLQTREGLIQVALGRISPELIIRNIHLVNVYSGEILRGQEVAVWQDRIAYVGPEAKIGQSTEVVDGKGMYLLPGFIDVHGHADFMSNPLALAKKILPTGTTGMLTDTHDICGALGPKGLKLMLDATADIPFRYYFAAPAAFPPIPEFEGEDIFTQDVVASFLANSRVLAVSEVTAWGRLMEPEREFVAKLVYAREQGKRIEGHMAGCSYEKLNALVSCGFTSCHESITAAEALDRLRLGLYAILRHGSIRADLEPLSEMITQNPHLDTSRVMLSPDWFSPQDVLKYGYLNYLVSEAVKLGIPAMKAIQMVTINPATYLGVDNDIGGIAPGRLADMLLVEDLENPFPETVWVGGKVVAHKGELTTEIPKFPEVRLEDWREGRIPPIPVKPEDFFIKSAGVTVEIPCIKMVNKTITKPVNLTLPVKNGYIDIQGSPDLLKISLWSALRNSWMTGLLTGFGATVGGIVSSIAHETHSPMAVGNNEQDMALAANRMLELGGGIVIVEAGQLVGEVPMTTGGILSNVDLEELAQSMLKLNMYLQEKGCPWDDPIFGLCFLAFTGLPYVRITPKGIVDIRQKKVIFP